MAEGQARSPHHYGALDRVIRSPDGMRGEVVAVETLRALVAWEDGAVDVVDQFDPRIRVEERSGVDSCDAAEIKARIARLESESGDIEWEIERLQDRQNEIDNQVEELEAALAAIEAAQLRLIEAARAVIV